MKTCKRCGKEFTPKQFIDKNGKSRTANKAINCARCQSDIMQNKNTEKSKQCLRCGKELEKYIFHDRYGNEITTYGSKIYCNACREKNYFESRAVQKQRTKEERSNYSKKTINCLQCGKEFKAKTKRSKYCQPCKEKRLQEANLRSSVKYNELHKRAIALIHSNIKTGHIATIYECPHEGNKHKHHFSYDKYPLLVLLLCPDCHSKEHSRLRRIAISSATANPSMPQADTNNSVPQQQRGNTEQEDRTLCVSH